MPMIRVPLLCRIALASALCAPLIATAADVKAAPAAASGSVAKAATKTTKAGADVKASAGDSAPGCDESNGPGKKGPSLPKCPEKLNKKINPAK